MKPNTEGLDEILGLWANSVQDHPDMSMPILTLSDTEQAILQWVADEVIGANTHGTIPGGGFKNNLRKEQRTILKQHSWKGVELGKDSFKRLAEYEGEI